MDNLTPNLQLSEEEISFVANAIKVWYNISKRSESEEAMIDVLQKKFKDAVRLNRAELFMNGIF
jgi:predicted DNA-binding transcriptional regulator YafY